MFSPGLKSVTPNKWYKLIHIYFTRVFVFLHWGIIDVVFAPFGGLNNVSHLTVYHRHQVNMFSFFFYDLCVNFIQILDVIVNLLGLLILWNMKSFHPEPLYIQSRYLMSFETLLIFDFWFFFFITGSLSIIALKIYFSKDLLLFVYYFRYRLYRLFDQNI